MKSLLAAIVVSSIAFAYGCSQGKQDKCDDGLVEGYDACVEIHAAYSDKAVSCGFEDIDEETTCESIIEECSEGEGCISEDTVSECTEGIENAECEQIETALEWCYDRYCKPVLVWREYGDRTGNGEYNSLLNNSEEKDPNAESTTS